MKDRTGNRRFFPISCGIEKPEKSVFTDADIDNEIDQVWAEALNAWNNGESLWIGYEMEQIAKKIQEQNTEENPLVGAVEEFLNKKFLLIGMKKIYKGALNIVAELVILMRWIMKI